MTPEGRQRTRPYLTGRQNPEKSIDCTCGHDIGWHGIGRPNNLRHCRACLCEGFEPKN